MKWVFSFAALATTMLVLCISSGASASEGTTSTNFNLNQLCYDAQLVGSNAVYLCGDPLPSGKSAQQVFESATADSIIHPNGTCGLIQNVAPPTISGTPQPGNTLHASPGSWTDQCYQIVSFGYGWSNGAGGPDYAVGDGDVGATLYVTVTACDTESNCASATSGGVTIQPNPSPPPPPPPVSVTITASPTSVAYGGVTTIGWSSSNATDCFATDGAVGWYGSRATSGSWTSPGLTSQTTFTITCGGVGRSVTVYVGGAPLPVVTLTASPNPATYGQNTTLSYSSTNSTGCSATWTTSTGTSGSQVVGPITVPTTYVINCGGAGGNASASVLVNVVGAPPDTTPPSTPGTPVKTAAGANSITVQWMGSTDNVAVAGYGLYRNGTLVSSTTGVTYTFSGLACGTTYTLAVDAYDAAGNRSAKASMAASTTACPITAPPTVNSFTSDTNGPWSGTSVTLAWSCTDATSVSIASSPSGGGATTSTTASGSWTTPSLPSGQYAYTLTCSNALGSPTATLYIGVFSADDEVTANATSAADATYTTYSYSNYQGCRWKSRTNENDMTTRLHLRAGGLATKVDWCFKNGRIMRVVRTISVIGPNYPLSGWKYEGITSYGPCSDNCSDYANLYGTYRSQINIWVQGHWSLCMSLPLVGSLCAQQKYLTVGVLIKGDGTSVDTYAP